MKIKIFRVSSLRVKDIDNKIASLSPDEKIAAVNKYQDQMAQYHVLVKYEENVYKVLDNFDYYYACQQLNVSKINIAILKYEVDSVKLELLKRAKKEVLNPMTAALIFEELKEIGKLGQKEIAVKIKKSQGAISNKHRLLKLPLFVQKEIENENIKERHGRAILQLNKLDNYEEEAKEVLTKILNENMKVSETVDIVHQKLGKETIKRESLRLKSVENRSDLKHPEVALIIEKLRKDLKESNEKVTSKFPNLKIELEDGIDKEDYVFLLKMKGINK